MTSDPKPTRKRKSESNKRSGDDGAGSTLLPMLISGLVLIVVGAIIVMSFV